MSTASFRRLTFCAAVCLIAGCSGSNNSSTGSSSGNATVASASGSRENLRPAVAEGIRLLENKAYKAFLESFAPSNWLAEKSKAFGGIDELAKDFEAKAATQMLAALKQTQKMEPEMTGDNQAKFDFRKVGIPNSQLEMPNLIFEKVGKNWRMKG